MTYVYPVIFTPYVEDGENYILVHCPDLDINTYSSNIAEAVTMAKDVLEMTLVDKEDNSITIPDPSNPATLTIDSGHDDVPSDESFVTMIVADTDEWRKQNDHRSIKKNCSIPAWLNRKAELANAPFSQLLQNALMDYLNIGQKQATN